MGSKETQPAYKTKALWTHGALPAAELASFSFRAQMGTKDRLWQIRRIWR